MGTSIGTITLVVSESHRDTPPITDLEAPLLVNQFTDYFRYLLGKEGLDQQFTVAGVQWSMGCITIILTLGALTKILVAGGVVTGTVEVLKQYKDGREGLSKLLEDLKNAKIWVRKWFRKKSAGASAEVPAVTTTPKTAEPPPPEPFRVIFEQMVSTYESLPAEQRKYWAAGQEMTILNEEGELCHYTLALKREDILPGTGEAQAPPQKSSKKKTLSR